jgi:hypothetical protein
MMTNGKYKTKSMTTRDHNIAMIKGFIESSDREWTSLELATKIGSTSRAVNLILCEMETEKLVTRSGTSRAMGVRWGRYRAPEVRVYEFKPLKPLKSTVIPVRGNGKIAPDIYKGVIFIGASS